MRMSEGDYSFINSDSKPTSCIGSMQSLGLRYFKTVILGIVIDVYRDRSRGIELRKQITRIKVRVFPDL